MEIVISNSKLKAVISSFGAELISLKKLEDNKEYIWQKDPTYWNKSSPVLFPFIGAIKNNQYSFEGVNYAFSAKHGFARDNEFELLSHSNDCAEFIFSSNEVTKKIYPFDFKFHMKYVLKENVLEIQYIVENLGDKKMYFSLGAHPAFNTPIDNNNSLSDYFVEFEKAENSEGYFLENSLFNLQNKRDILSHNKFYITEDIFKDDVLILTDTNSKKVSLKNRNNSFSLGFSFNGFKHLAFWSKPKAPYLCLEPWNGLPDSIDADGKLENKRDIEVLEAGKTYTRTIEIEIF